jgi:catechol 2,3-dioxygenase-like lactoylglutathione lyase family enzyme|nr:VOC family protein [Kofleriaceae bacterium]
MDFLSIRIITDDPQRLAGFYQRVTGIAPTWYTPDFGEVVTPSCTLAIAHRRTMELFAAGAARPADNHSVIVEFRVADVDALYREHADALGAPVQPPTTMPWGNRSLLVRDPDGNLVNFFTPVTPQAIAKLARR